MVPSNSDHMDRLEGAAPCASPGKLADRSGSDSAARGMARRSLLRYLAASPLLASPLWPQVQQALAGDEEGEVIAAVNEAINVFDFHAVAREKLPPAHYGYLATGTLDDSTSRANRTGFSKWQLRLRRLVDVKRLDTSIELLGKRWNFPICLAPIGNQEAFHLC